MSVKEKKKKKKRIVERGVCHLVQFIVERRIDQLLLERLQLQIAQLARGRRRRGVIVIVVVEIAVDIGSTVAEKLVVDVVVAHDVGRRTQH